VNYDELAELANSMPRIPKKELKCHQLVVDYLRWDTLHHPVHRDPISRAYEAWACPVYVDNTMEPGAWEFYEDGALKASGNIEHWYG
jgi:hypothetical protein